MLQQTAMPPVYVCVLNYVTTAMVEPHLVRHVGVDGACHHSHGCRRDGCVAVGLPLHVLCRVAARAVLAVHAARLRAEESGGARNAVQSVHGEGSGRTEDALPHALVKGAARLAYLRWRWRT